MNGNRLIPYAMVLSLTLSLNAACAGDPGFQPSDGKKEGENPSGAQKLVVTLRPAGIENAKLVVAKIGEHEIAPRLDTTAVISADPQKIAQVGSYMAGRVARICIRLGDRVEKGTPLLEVDSIEMHQVSTEYRSALAQARQAKDMLSRQEKLAKEHVSALQELSRAQTAAQQAKANFDESEEHLMFLGLDASTVSALRQGKSAGVLRSIVRSPLPGIVAALSVNIGEVLGAKEQLVTIMDINPVWATLRLFETDLKDVKIGAPVDIAVASYPGRKFSGKVEAISDLIDSSTRSVEVRTKLNNQDGSLKPGMSAVASISLSDDGGGTWLPAESVQQYGDHKIIFRQTGTVDFVADIVTVDAERANFVKVVPRIATKTPIVVDGALLLRGELARGSLGED